MLNIFKRLSNLEANEKFTADVLLNEIARRTALEDYLGIEFFHGDKMRPHYRKKKQIAKKVGRPKGVKNKKKKEPDVIVVV